MTASIPIWQSPEWIRQTQLLLNSFSLWTGRALQPRSNDPLEESQALFQAEFVIVSHGTEADPLLNYANQVALSLWEATPDELLGMPSRLTAEAHHREERSRLLAETHEQGFSANYRGIRISRSGRRFEISEALVWNLVDEEQRPAGQAATFSNWTYLG